MSAQNGMFIIGTLLRLNTLYFTLVFEIDNNRTKGTRRNGPFAWETTRSITPGRALDKASDAQEKSTLLVRDPGIN